jgi:carboxymethylenebutenolidase
MARITLPSGTPAELVLPSGGSPDRGLVLWPDVFGLRPLFDDHVRRLADEQNWAVCAVEIFPGGADLTLEERFATMSSLSDADKVADAVAAADACGVDPVGLLGFCMGGMYVMKSTVSHRFDRAVAFYGMVHVPEPWQGPDQHDALDSVAAKGDTDLLCIFGMKDPWCPPADIDEVEAAGAVVVRYPDADHGWAQDSSRENYRADDAEDAWSRAIDFLTNGPG